MRGISSSKRPLIVTAKDEKDFVSFDVKSSKFTSNELNVSVEENGKELSNICVKKEVVENTKSRNADLNVGKIEVGSTERDMKENTNNQNGTGNLNSDSNESSKNIVSIVTDGVDSPGEATSSEPSTKITVTVEKQSKEVTNISMNPNDLTPGNSFTESTITKTIHEKTQIVTRTLSSERIHVTVVSDNASNHSSSTSLELSSIDGKVESMKVNSSKQIEENVF